MPYILPTNYYSKSPLRILEEELPSGFHLITLAKASKEDLVEKVVSADYLLVGGRTPIDMDVLNAAVNLKMIQRTGVGLDSLDAEAIKKKNVPVYVNRGINARSVAEHTLLLMLSALRRLPVVDASVKSGKWQKHELGIQSFELFEKSVGLVGLGHIGTEVARLLRAFDAYIYYFDPIRRTKEQENDLNIIYLPLNELLGLVDILSLHCPLSRDTEGLIGLKEIAAMKSGSIVINTSRGRLIDEQALIDGLVTGHIRSAGLDVFSKEPIAADNPLLSLPHVILSPHIGGITYESFRRMISGAMQNIRFFEEGKMDLLESKRLYL